MSDERTRHPLEWVKINLNRWDSRFGSIVFQAHRGGFRLYLARTEGRPAPKLEVYPTLPEAQREMQRLDDLE